MTLVLVGTLVYLNQIGLPKLIKGPLLDSLRARGLDLRFSRLRLNWYGGLRAEDVAIGQFSTNQPVRFTAAEALVQLDPAELLRLGVQVDSVTLRKGRLTVPLEETNGPRRELTVNNIEADLRLLPKDQWSLERLTAEFAGAGIRLSGSIANASAMRDWRIFQRREPARPGHLQQQLRAVADALERTHFSAPPELTVEVRGDALNPNSFTARLLLDTPGADTPWGAIENGRLNVKLHSATDQALPFATIFLNAGRGRSKWGTGKDVQLEVEATGMPGAGLPTTGAIKLRAAAAETQWASGTGVVLSAAMAPLEGDTNLIKGNLAISLGQAATRWAQATEAQFTANWLQPRTNPAPTSLSGVLSCGTATSRWASARGFSLAAEVAVSPHAPSLPEPSLGWWTNLQPYEIQWRAGSETIWSNNIAAQEVRFAGHWASPNLDVTNFHALISTGRVDLAAQLNIQSRQAAARAEVRFDPTDIMPLLTAGARRWFSQFTWKGMPWARSEIGVVLPAWTERQPDWRDEVRPSLRLNGEFEVSAGGSYRGVPVESARSHFIYSNCCWRLPDLFVTRPEGTLTAEHRSDDVTKEFYWRVASTLDPGEVAPLLGTNGHRVKDFLQFAMPPLVSAEVWGRHREPSSTALIGQVAGTNFSMRGEAFTGVQSKVLLTNQVLTFIEPRVQRGTQQLSAEGVVADFNSRKIFLTNAFSTAEVMPVARAIGPAVAKAVEPYSFGKPPTIHVNGVVPMKGEQDADLRFVVEGGPFNWLTFHTPRIVGNIQWQGDRLLLSRVRTDLYGGEAAGYASFRFRPHQPAEYEFAVTTTNTFLKPLMQDVFSQTNQVEGWLTAGLVVTHGTTDDWRKWDGYGSARLHDGLIWDIPVFGMLSPVLNSIVPGLGNSRASSGTFTFNMTNGVLHSDDLEIRSSGMRLQYRGSVDLHTRLNARVEAELLRDMWVVGPLVSTVFWPVSKMFEYRVTGTLADPHLEPVYFVPRLMQLPFQPFRIFRGLFPDETAPLRNPPGRFEDFDNSSK